MKYWSLTNLNWGKKSYFTSFFFLLLQLTENLTLFNESRKNIRKLLIKYVKSQFCKMSCLCCCIRCKVFYFILQFEWKCPGADEAYATMAGETERWSRSATWFNPSSLTSTMNYSFYFSFFAIQFLRTFFCFVFNWTFSVIRFSPSRSPSLEQSL